MATVSQKILDQYRVSIGIETHVQLKTRTKLFSAVANDAREAPPNTLISHIDLGLPGALPVLNEAAVYLASRAAFALGTKPQKFSKFDRKHYFYPDLPSGYQITQFYDPIIRDGLVRYRLGKIEKQVRITEAHLEADAGKSLHPQGADYSLVDLNRAGTPLLEIVSAPDIHSPSEAKAYARELYLLVKYAGVSEASLYYGNMRFDVNVSVSKSDILGIRTETKNLNSFKSIEKAAEYEIKRQIEILEGGGSIVQETRGWDDAKQKTFSQRSKEGAHDYRYMPDPDLPPVILSEEFIARAKGSMPTMPSEWRERLSELALEETQIETLLDGEVEFEDISFLPLLEGCLMDKDQTKFLVNWQINITMPLARDNKYKLTSEEAFSLSREIYNLIKDGKLSSSNAKLAFNELIQKASLPDDIESFVQERGFIQVTNSDEISLIVSSVLADNPKATDDLKNGEMKVIGYLVGQVMKKSAGKANPSTAQEIIKKKVGIR